ncbi:MAG: DNA polymerase III subunit beta [Proteobacteria bacterium]|nr:DNA polymerase III subunit beta [Pseudomonadota bacterium]
MKIIISQNTLLLALTRIQSIVEKSSIIPITANALIVAKNASLTVSATNLEIGMIANYKNINIEKEGKIFINAKKFFEIIKELPDEDITITEKENYHIEVNCKKVTFNILGLPPEDFPLFSQQEPVPYIEWETEKLKKMIDYTSFSISIDETRMNINGAFIEKLEDGKVRMVTTDGYRLSMVDENISGEFPFNGGFLISQKGITELRKIISDKKEETKLSIMIIKNSLLIKLGEVELYIRLIEKKFPEYKYIIQQAEKNDIKIKVIKNNIKAALKRMSIIANENKRPVRFNFKNNIIEIFTEDSELGSVYEIIEMEEKIKNNFSFSINGKYFLDILQAVDDDVIININVSDKNKPILFNPISKIKATYIIMPMLSD